MMKSCYIKKKPTKKWVSCNQFFMIYALGKTAPEGSTLKSNTIISAVRVG